jgi:ABC-type uncharacterized transport system YnjBCD permease subunit
MSNLKRKIILSKKKNLSVNKIIFSHFHTGEGYVVNACYIKNRVFVRLVMKAIVLNVEMCLAQKNNVLLATSLGYSRIMGASLVIFAGLLFEDLSIGMYILIELAISIFV